MEREPLPAYLILDRPGIAASNAAAQYDKWKANHANDRGLIELLERARKAEIRDPDIEGVGL